MRLRAGGAPTGGRREPRGHRAACSSVCLSRPQCSSSTRKPGRSSCRWWRSWQPDPKTSRRCRTRVSPHRFRVAQGPSSRLACRSAPPALPRLVLQLGLLATPGAQPSRPLPPSPQPGLPRLAVTPLPSGLSFWRGAGWRRQDGVPKFFPSAAETAEAIVLFGCEAKRVKLPDWCERGPTSLFPYLPQPGKCQVES